MQTTQQNSTMITYLFYGLVLVAIVGVIVSLSMSSSPSVTVGEQPQAHGMMRGPLASASTAEETKQYLLTTDEGGNLENSNVLVNQIDQNKQELLTLANQNCPPGTIVMWGATDAPAGWVLCNGQDLNRTNPLYARLYIQLQYTYGGSGDTFKVPNLSGRFPMGVGGDHITQNPKQLGSQGGSEEHTLTVAEMPVHNHKYQDRILVTQTLNRPSNGSGKIVPKEHADFERTTVSTGGNQPHNNMPPFLVVNFIIKL